MKHVFVYADLDSVPVGLRPFAITRDDGSVELHMVPAYALRSLAMRIEDILSPES